MDPAFPRPDFCFQIRIAFSKNKCRGQKKQFDQIWVPDLLWLKKPSMGVIFCVESGTRCGPATNQPTSSQIYHSYISNHFPTPFIQIVLLKNYEIIQSDRSMAHPAKQNMRPCLNFFVCFLRGFKLTLIVQFHRMLNNFSSCFAAY